MANLLNKLVISNSKASLSTIMISLILTTEHGGIYELWIFTRVYSRHSANIHNTLSLSRYILLSLTRPIIPFMISSTTIWLNKYNTLIYIPRLHSIFKLIQLDTNIILFMNLKIEIKTIRIYDILYFFLLQNIYLFAVWMNYMLDPEYGKNKNLICI